MCLTPGAMVGLWRAGARAASRGAPGKLRRSALARAGALASCEVRRPARAGHRCLHASNLQYSVWRCAGLMCPRASILDSAVARASLVWWAEGGGGRGSSRQLIAWGTPRYGPGSRQASVFACCWIAAAQVHAESSKAVAHALLACCACRTDSLRPPSQRPSHPPSAPQHAHTRHWHAQHHAAHLALGQSRNQSILWMHSCKRMLTSTTELAKSSCGRPHVMRSQRHGGRHSASGRRAARCACAAELGPGARRPRGCEALASACGSTRCMRVFGLFRSSATPLAARATMSTVSRLRGRSTGSDRFIKARNHRIKAYCTCLRCSGWYLCRRLAPLPACAR